MIKSFPLYKLVKLQLRAPQGPRSGQHVQVNHCWKSDVCELGRPIGGALVYSSLTEPSLGVGLLKRAEGKLGMKKQSDWLQSAACAGKSEMFTVRDLQLGNGEPYSEAKHKLAENQKFKDAIRICQSCPVQQQCGETAEPEDWRWTVRAGRMPAVFKTRSRGWPSKRQASSNTCSHGHVGRMVEDSNGRRCLECKRLWNENQRRSEGQKKRQGRKTECEKHGPMTVLESRNVCRPCENERNKRRWQETKAARMSS